MKIRPWRDHRMDVLQDCPRCGEDFHVHATFNEGREAGRFLWWRWASIAPHWEAYCGQCGFGYRAPALEQQHSDQRRGGENG